MKKLLLALLLIAFIATSAFAANTVTGRIYYIDTAGTVETGHLFVASIGVSRLTSGDFQVVFEDVDGVQTWDAKQNFSTQNIGAWTPAREVVFPSLVVRTISNCTVNVYTTRPSLYR